MFYLLIAILFLVGVVFHISVMYSRSGKLINRIPGPPILPIIGNGIMMAVPPEKLFDVMQSFVNGYFPIVRVWLGSIAMIGIAHPDDFEVVLSSQKAIDKNYIYEYIGAWLKTGLLTSSGTKWRQRRKLLTPAFHFHVLQKYNNIVNDQARLHVEALRREDRETVQSLMSLTSMLTLRIICDSKIDKREVQEYTRAIHDVGHTFASRSVMPYILDWMLPFTSIGRKQKRALKVLHEFSNKVVRERREYHRQNDYRYLREFDDDDVRVEKVEDVGAGRRKRFAMLDLLLSAEQKGLIDNEGILEEVDTFSFEGHDTSGMALVFLIMLLAENEEAQDKARDEVEKLMNRTNQELSTTDLSELEYLERCIKEALRLFPSVPYIFRYLKEDLQLKNYLLPAGSNIVCSIYGLQRSELFWPEPLKFDPDRFLPERAQGRHAFAYAPFSAGPRNCIGQKFAMMELKSIAAHILYNFRLEPVSLIRDLKFSVDLVLRPTFDVKTKFIRIDRM